MKKVSLVSGLIYTAVSLLAAGTFLAVTLAGDYTAVARFGGAAWVFSLSMIVLMPAVTSAVKRRTTRTQGGEHA